MLLLLHAGVRKLFDQETSKAELITVEADPAAQQIVVTWRLEGRVNLPFKPKIKPYVVTTKLGLNSDGLICSQLDEFSVPGSDLLLSIIFGEGGQTQTNTLLLYKFIFLYKSFGLVLPQCSAM